MTPNEHRAYLQGIAAAADALASQPQRRSRLIFQKAIAGLEPPVGTHEAYLMGSEETAAELGDRIRDLIAKENEIAKEYAPRAPVVDLATRRPMRIEGEAKFTWVDPSTGTERESGLFSAAHRELFESVRALAIQRATLDDIALDLSPRWLTTI